MTTPAARRGDISAETGRAVDGDEPDVFLGTVHLSSFDRSAGNARRGPSGLARERLAACRRAKKHREADRAVAGHGEDGTATA